MDKGEIITKKEYKKERVRIWGEGNEGKQKKSSSLDQGRRREGREEGGRV